MATKNSIGKIPPQNIEAEQSLLGCLLIDKDSLVKIADIIRADDFYKDAHRKIFETILELYEKREPIDLIGLGNRLEERGTLEKIGGKTYLTTLANAQAARSRI